MAEVLNSSRNLVWKTFVPEPLQRRARSATDVSASSSGGRKTPQSAPSPITTGPTALQTVVSAPSDFAKARPEHPSSPSFAPTPESRPPLSAPDDELFQHFVSVTAQTLSQGDAVLLHIYTHLAPTLARERPYLMDCMLAMSGNHRLTTLTQSRSNSTPEAAALQKLVLEYQSRALRSYSRGMNTAQSIDDCTAVSIAGILVLMFTFADRQNPERDSHPASRWALSKSHDIFKLQAGIGAFMQSNWRTISKSDMKALLNYPLVHQNVALDTDTAEALASLDHLIRASSLPSQELDLFVRALHGLRNVFSAMVSDKDDVGHRLGWLVGSDASTFADLVQMRRPEALVIAAYWGASLRNWPHAWWEQGLGREIVREVLAELGAPYQPYLRWPIQQYDLSSAF